MLVPGSGDERLRRRLGKGDLPGPAGHLLARERHDGLLPVVADLPLDVHAQVQGRGDGAERVHEAADRTVLPSAGTVAPLALLAGVVDGDPHCGAALVGLPQRVADLLGVLVADAARATCAGTGEADLLGRDGGELQCHGESPRLGGAAGGANGLSVSETEVGVRFSFGQSPDCHLPVDDHSHGTVRYTLHRAVLHVTPTLHATVAGGRPPDVASDAHTGSDD